MVSLLHIISIGVIFMYISKEEFYSKMKSLQNTSGDDPEKVHSEMDKLMCDVLCGLGYEDGIKIFKDTKKYYA